MLWVTVRSYRVLLSLLDTSLNDTFFSKHEEENEESFQVAQNEMVGA